MSNIEGGLDMTYKQTVIRKHAHLINIKSSLEEDMPYVLGVKPSSPIEKDTNEITVVDPYTKDIIVEFVSSDIPSDEFAIVTECLMRLFTPKGIMCIERNGTGAVLIDYLSKTTFKDNIYSRDKSKMGISITKNDIDIMDKVIESYETGLITKSYLLALYILKSAKDLEDHGLIL